MGRERKHWGWGYVNEQPSGAELSEAAGFLARHLGFGALEPRAPAPLPPLPAPRLRVPPGLAGCCSLEPLDRARHTYGSSYRDVVRGFRGEFAARAPDVVARPTDDDTVLAVLEWALAAGAAVVPYGGGTSVVGGVEAGGEHGLTGTVCIDTTALSRVLDVDEVSLSARIQAGASGPELERQLGERGLTLRHFPQSFQFQTLGGAIATRASGHFATGPTHIDDFVQSVRMLTPAGWWESRRLPSSGAGPSPDRAVLGSEGTLGLITEAWVRVLRKPTCRASRAVTFETFAAGTAAVRAIVQAGWRPANLRLIDADEARVTFVGDGSAAVLLVGFESSGAAVDAALAAALECCADFGGAPVGVAEPASVGAGDAGTGSGGDHGGPAELWRDAFFRAPYVRDVLVSMCVVSETFESAVTWDRLGGFVDSVLAATRAAVREICGAGHVSCRLTHVYPDGAAPYFTVLAPARWGAELEQWAAIKDVAGAAILAGGGTITHHHGVGRDHRRWYDEQRPAAFARALAATKSALDPGWQMNPGVLLDRPS